MSISSSCVAPSGAAKGLSMKCMDCKYFRWETQYRKLCVRYPPAAIPIMSGVDTYWPVVNETDWCGEFQTKISSKQKEHA